MKAWTPTLTGCALATECRDQLPPLIDYCLLRSPGARLLAAVYLDISDLCRSSSSSTQSIQRYNTPRGFPLNLALEFTTCGYRTYDVRLVSSSHCTWNRVTA